MVARDLRQVAGELIAGDQWQEEEEDHCGCMFGNSAPMSIMLQGHGNLVQNIKGSVEISEKLILQRAGACEEQSFEPASATTKSGYVNCYLILHTPKVVGSFLSFSATSISIL